MKQTNRLTLFAALLCAFVLSLITTPTRTEAAAPIESAMLASQSLALDLAQSFAADAGSLLPAPRSALFVAQTEAPAPSDNSANLGLYVGIALALVSGLAAIWQNGKATQNQKIAQSIILGVEQATKLPQVAEFEKRVKGTIAQKTRELGIEKEVDALVQRVTR
jgi:hypothetical protein